MNLHDRVGQMFLVGFDGLEAPPHILDWLRAGRIGGVILFARNVQSPEQVWALTQSIHAAARYPALVAIDQEGGTVARLRSQNGFTESPGAMALAAAPNDEGRAAAVSRALAGEMRAVGINWTYAPAVDITYNAGNPTVGTRSFGSTGEQVARLAAAAVTGFQRGGVAACAKHFPGLGNTAVDTHLALATLDTPLETLLQDDLLPYRAAAEAAVASVMTTHTVFTVLDPHLPVTLSPVVIQRLLREELGYDGVVTSDCMEMKAVADHHSPGEIAVLGALAGLDIILISHTVAAQAPAFDSLLAAVESGRVPESRINEANRRIAAMKAWYGIHVQEEHWAMAGDLGRVGHPDTHAWMVKIAQDAVTCVRGETPFPLTGQVTLVEFASVLESDVVERGDMTGIARAFNQQRPDVETLAIKSTASADQLNAAAGRVREADTVIIATRNAHLIPEQRVKADALIQAARSVNARVALVCLRNPYDAPLFRDTDLTLCTCGDSTPSLDAAVNALLGRYEPRGRLPVELDMSVQP